MFMNCDNRIKKCTKQFIFLYSCFFLDVDEPKCNWQRENAGIICIFYNEQTFHNYIKK